MTYLTQVPSHHPSFQEQKWNNAQWLHNRVMSLFEDFEGGSDARRAAGILFRTEPAGKPTQLLVQSAIPPLDQTLTTKDITPLLEALTPDRALRFRITANPVKTINRTVNGQEVRRRVLVSDPSEWLQNRLDGLSDIRITDSTPHTQRTGKGGKLIAVTFDGYATVKNPEELVRVIQNGVGRAKAYGCGMLSVALK